MDHPATDSEEAVTVHGGEIEIEKLSLHEVELRRRELLPVFKQFHYPEQNRNLARGQFQNALSDIGHTQYTSAKDNDAYEPKPVPHISGFYTDMRKTENMNGLAGQLFCGPIPAVDKPMEKCNSIESHKATNLIANHKVDNGSIRASSIMPQSRENVDCVPSHIRPSTKYSLLDQPLDNGSSPASNDSYGTEVTNNSSVSNGAMSDIPNGCHKSVSSGQNGTPGSHNSGEFTQYFQEGYCKISELDDCRELTEAVTDADSSSSHCEREKPEEDGDNDDMLGGVFAFSEEG